MARTIAGLIKGYSTDVGIGPCDLAKYIGIVPSAYYRRIKEPKMWRLGELNSLYNFLNIPQEERIYEE